MFIIRILVIGGGKFIKEDIAKSIINECDIIIAADGAGKYLYDLDVMPDMLVGDFDTLEKNILDFYKRKKVNICEFSPIKDKSDLELSIDLAMENNPKEIIIIGALGTRMDHSLSNIMLLFHILDKNINVKLIDNNNEIIPIKDEIIIDSGKYEYVSLLPIFDDLEGVELKGFEYESDNLYIKKSSTLGISNEIKKDKASIKIKSGKGLVILSND
ncbi:thiamine diphosphokinase [Senegalia massiliensis]|uniref:thiamine diphosphokinase n=1 Tax=Senegalia massiliensis TaxID=1720316 RepID=UPI0013EF0AC0|nr:thiamine diphosphokinase [Senegalia massiliensis]